MAGTININEAGGIFAGIVALLVSIGGGIRWLLNWTERRETNRAAKLQKWSDELEAREVRLEAERTGQIRSIEGRLDEVLNEHRALFQAYYLLASALVRLDPNNPALTQASALLAAAFRLDPHTPDGMLKTLEELKQ